MVATTGAAERSQKIQSVIETIYGKGGIDRVLSYGLKGEDIVGQFEASGQKFNFTIFDDGEVEYQPVNSRGDSTTYALGECVAIAERMGIPTKGVSPTYLQGYLSDLRHDAKPKTQKSGQQTTADKLGRVKTCTTGKTYPCGGACFANSRACRKDPGAQAKATAQDVKKELKDTSGQKEGKGTKERNTSTNNLAEKNRHSVKSFEEFNDIASHVIDKLKDKHDNLVPIHEIRKEIGELVSRSDFDKHMKEMQANDSIQLVGGEMTGITEEKMRDSIPTTLSGIRYYAKPSSLQKKSKLKDKDIEDKLKNKPALDPLGSASKFKKGNPIKDYKSFEKDVKEIIDTLDSEFHYDNLTPIHKVRDALGDRVSKEDFDKYMKELQSGDSYVMESDPNLSLSKEEEDKSVSTQFGVKHYIRNEKKMNFGKKK